MHPNSASKMTTSLMMTSFSSFFLLCSGPTCFAPARKIHGASFSVLLAENDPRPPNTDNSKFVGSVPSKRSRTAVISIPPSDQFGHHGLIFLGFKEEPRSPITIAPPLAGFNATQPPRAKAGLMVRLSSVTVKAQCGENHNGERRQILWFFRQTPRQSSANLPLEPHAEHPIRN